MVAEGAQRVRRPRVGRGRDARALEDPAPVEFVGMRDQFGKSGEFEELLDYFDLGSRAIVEAVKKVMAR